MGLEKREDHSPRVLDGKRELFERRGTNCGRRKIAVHR